jgi:3-dehydroquinate synthetase
MRSKLQRLWRAAAWRGDRDRHAAGGATFDPTAARDAPPTPTVAALLARFGLADIDPARTSSRNDLLDLMRLDKKNLSGRLRLILWRGIGQAEIVPDVDEAAYCGCWRKAEDQT